MPLGYARAVRAPPYLLYQRSNGSPTSTAAMAPAARNGPNGIASLRERRRTMTKTAETLANTWRDDAVANALRMIELLGGDADH